MKKLFLILVIAIGFGIIAKAQDIILKHDGSEIIAKVLEVTDQQIKYKEFDFQNGPVRNINISEIFMVTYENGKKEVFNKSNETNVASPKRQSVTNCVKKTAFGLDIGFGGSFDVANGEKSETWSASALGARVTHHFNQYFGIDFLKINWITEIGPSKSNNPWIMRFQLMPGIRGNSPVFFKCMSVYAAFRLGYGLDFNQFGSHLEGLCIEPELGLNLTPNIYAGFAYNYNKFFNKGKPLGFETHILSVRFGFNFGKAQREVFNKQTPLPLQQRDYQSDLEREFYRIGTNDKAMLNFFKRINSTEYYTKFESACNLRRDGVGLISAGAGLMGFGIILMGAGLADNSISLTTGFVFIGAGGAFTIASIPIFAVAGARKKAIKNDFVRQYFSSYTYQPTLNFNCTGNGLGIALKL